MAELENQEHSAEEVTAVETTEESVVEAAEKQPHEDAEKGDTNPVKQEINYSEKSYWILALCFFFCFLGAQQFYLGNKKAGFIRLGCFIILIGLPISIILAIKDLVQLYRGKLYDSKGLPVITPQQMKKKIQSKIMYGSTEEEAEDKANELITKIKQNTDIKDLD